jgi:hypothetical protein
MQSEMERESPEAPAAVAASAGAVAEAGPGAGTRSRRKKAIQPRLPSWPIGSDGFVLIILSSPVAPPGDGRELAQ